MDDPSTSSTAVAPAAVATAAVAATVAATVAVTAVATISAAVISATALATTTLPPTRNKKKPATSSPDVSKAPSASKAPPASKVPPTSKAPPANKVAPTSKPLPNTKLQVSVATDATCSSLPTVCLTLDGKGKGAVSVPLPPPMALSPSIAAYSRTTKQVNGSLNFGDGRTLRFKVGDVASDAERERGVSLAGYVQCRDGLRRQKLLLVLTPELAAEISVLGTPRAAQLHVRFRIATVEHLERQEAREALLDMRLQYSLRYMRLQPPLHTVTASVYTRLQPPSPAVTGARGAAGGSERGRLHDAPCADEAGPSPRRRGGAHRARCKPAQDAHARRRAAGRRPNRITRLS